MSSGGAGGGGGERQASAPATGHPPSALCDGDDVFVLPSKTERNEKKENNFFSFEENKVEKKDDFSNQVDQILSHINN